MNRWTFCTGVRRISPERSAGVRGSHVGSQMPTGERRRFDDGGSNLLGASPTWSNRNAAQVAASVTPCERR